MRRGRPPLEPEVQLQHRRESLQRYAAKNGVKLREAARLRMRRKREAIRTQADYNAERKYKLKASEASQRYRDRKERRETGEMLAKHAAKRRTSKLAGKKTIKKTSSASHIKPRAPVVKTLLSRAPKTPQTLSAIDAGADFDSSDSENEQESDKIHSSVPSAFPERTRGNTVPTCGECGLEGCPGCFCMCPVSTVWVKHADGQGHFFATCSFCGSRDDCPGCACVCPKAREYIEHGGHME
ncbi:hypothetical protein R3P38DRAFT_2792669 [Favolaschia claudopus]|uniref:Uncharacterized protein n=1 Tax=Favolaschia claudopus TaxID=2862362 RepID=A0AAW0AEK1_9AGAR